MGTTTTTDAKLEAYLDANQEARLRSYEAFLRIPSISALPEHAADCRRAAEFVVTELDGAERRGSFELLEGA